MSVRSRPFQQIAVVVNAVALVVGLICYQSGVFFSAATVTQEDLNAAINARPADAVQPLLNSERHPSDVAAVASGRPDYHQLDSVPSGGLDNQTSGVETAENKALSDDWVRSNRSIFRFDQLRQQPGPVSRELLLNDSVEVIMSSSKSTVLIPKTPEEKQKAIDRYLASATSSFQSLDRDHNEQLTEAELGDPYWTHFRQQGVVQDGNLNFDGFLKHYVWYKSEHFRRNRH